ncbi:MAG: hypothetical protein ACJARS_003675 [bacterium]|jgi:hypothetical protein
MHRGVADATWPSHDAAAAEDNGSVNGSIATHSHVGSTGQPWCSVQ